MYIYLIIIPLLLSFIWLIFGPTENSGGDATLFIKAADPNRNKRIKKPKFDSSNCNVYKQPGKQVLILYGTAYGFAERLGRKLYMQLKSVGSDIQPRLVNMSIADNYIELAAETCVLNIISTAGDGVPPSDARAFIDNLLHNNFNLASTHYATLALGDTNYPQYCAAGKLVDLRFSELGGKQLQSVQLVDKEDYPVIDAWFTSIIDTVSSLDIPVQPDYLASKQPANSSTTFSRNNPYAAKIIKKELLTKLGRSDDKEIIHVEIDIGGSDLSYTEGDAIGIVPLNNPVDVQHILKSINKLGIENVVVDGHDNITTLNDALTQCYDLRVVQSTLIQQLCNYAESNQLDTLKAGVADTEVVELLADYHAAASQIPVQSLCDSLRPLQPRYYSISSSPIINNTIAAVTAGVIRYDLPTRKGTGVCTTYLADRMNVNDTVNVFISVNHDFRLPSNPTTPIIMIGPGTGLAPFRAFIQNRIAQPSCGSNWLYFGCRHADRDFTYRNELQHWADNKQIQLRTAFSRDQAQKIYVQNLLEQDGAHVYDLIHHQSAHLYVCGDGAAMAKDVHNVLIQIIQQYGNTTAAQAELYLTDLTKQNRYEKDVWIT